MGTRHAALRQYTLLDRLARFSPGLVSLALSASAATPPVSTELPGNDDILSVGFLTLDFTAEIATGGWEGAPAESNDPVVIERAGRAIGLPKGVHLRLRKGILYGQRINTDWHAVGHQTNFVLCTDWWRPDVSEGSRFKSHAGTGKFSALLTIVQYFFEASGGARIIQVAKLSIVASDILASAFYGSLAETPFQTIAPGVRTDRGPETLQLPVDLPTGLESVSIAENCLGLGCIKTDLVEAEKGCNCDTVPRRHYFLDTSGLRAVGQQNT